MTQHCDAVEVCRTGCDGVTLPPIVVADNDQVPLHRLRWRAATGCNTDMGACGGWLTLVDIAHQLDAMPCYSGKTYRVLVEEAVSGMLYIYSRVMGHWRRYGKTWGYNGKT